MPFTTETAGRCARRSHEPAGRAKRLLATVPEDDPEGWAEQLAASLPPLTASEAAGIGKLAAVLDARRITSDDGGRAA